VGLSPQAEARRLSQPLQRTLGASWFLSGARRWIQWDVQPSSQIGHGPCYPIHRTLP
jgi:hypothetical protein